MSVRQAIRAAEVLLPGVPLANDSEIDPRWQAIIALADYIDSAPESVWSFIAKWGCHSQEDLQTAIATVLLEHFLERHFAFIFPRVEALALKNRNFASTYSMCWAMGQAKEPRNLRRFNQLKERCERPAT